ncbi:MAG: BolA family protein [Candidatus Berkiella sp.]
MQPEEIKKMIESNIPDSQATVSGDGRHFEAFVVAPIFEGMGLLARQRQVYSALGNNIHNGNIHALSIKAKTPSEFEKEKQK